MTIFFDDIVGQETILAALQNILHSGQISQSYILNGERGAGKKDLALAFAAALQCTDRREENGRIQACGCCRSCRQIAAGSHPDVITLTNELAGAQTKTKIIGVRAARFVQTDVRIRPAQGVYKIYLIPDAHTLNQQAQNALLKTLEDPPSYALFLLLSENTSAFLPTVLSRCITLQLKAVPETDLLRMLEREGITGQRALIAARLSHGNPGRCRELTSTEEEQLRSEMTAFLKRMPDVNSQEIVQYSERLAAAKSHKDGDGQERSRVRDFLDLGRSWFRDLLIAKICAGTADTLVVGAEGAAPDAAAAGAAADRLIFQDEIQYINIIAVRLSMTALETVLQAFDQADRYLAAKENEVQIMETLLLNIRRAMSDLYG